MPERAWEGKGVSLRAPEQDKVREHGSDPDGAEGSGVAAVSSGPGLERWPWGSESQEVLGALQLPRISLCG